MENQEHPKEKKKKSNVWKWLFIALLAVNLLFFGAVAAKLLIPAHQSTSNQAQATSGVQKAGTVTTTTEELDQLIAGYTQGMQANGLNYQFYIENKEVVLQSSYSVIGISIPVYLYFDPTALGDGSVKLSAKKVVAGSFDLPAETALNMLASYQLPEFVEVKPSEKVIILDMAKMKIGEKIYPKVKQIDLEKGKFVFELMKKS